MHANIGELPGRTAPSGKPFERLISIPYLLLRAATAGGALATGLIQTFVFARILTPERFSIFIVVAATGYTLWLADLGLGNIAFVNLRGSYLAGTRNEQRRPASHSRHFILRPARRSPRHSFAFS